MERPAVRVAVWDGWVRLFHWSILVLVIVSYATAKADAIWWHMLSGHAVLALLIFRLAWGGVGSDTARFVHFVRPPTEALRHARRLWRGEAEPAVGHNAAGGWMVVLLLGLLLAQVVTGLFADDEELYRGPFADWVGFDASQRITGWHQRLVNILFAAIVLHVAAVAAYRIWFGRNLVAPMITGSTEVPADSPAALSQPRMASHLRATLLLAASSVLAWSLWRIAQG